MYLDAAHGGWLGWDNNINLFAGLVSELNVASKIRGFSTNVANYQPIGELCPWESKSSPTRNDYCLQGGSGGNSSCCSDPCKLESQWNPANNELNYAQALQVTMSLKIAGFKPMMVIDTGRNGVADMRSDCSNWCNPRGAGVGYVATTKTANTTIVDAYYWLKTPGESDGCTKILPEGGDCPRFDTMCASVDSIGSDAGEPRAPQAGTWFDYQIKQLAANANLAAKNLSVIV